jgi:hypothetical protein
MLIVASAFYLWFSLMLLIRRPGSRSLQTAGLGSLCFATGLAIAALGGVSLVWAIIAAALWLISAALGLPGVRQIWLSGSRPRATLLIGGGTVLLCISSLGLLIRFDWLPIDLATALVAIDGLILMLGVAGFDAFDQGLEFGRDWLGALTSSATMAAVFALQGVLFGATPALLLALTLSAVSLPILAEPAQQAIDGLLLRTTPQTSTARRQLRQVAAALPQATEASALATLSTDEFFRITRRALSAMTDLSKMATNPLTQHPFVLEQLTTDAPPAADVIGRAVALKSVLTEAIARLKPNEDAEFGTSDAWRHYNALHIPYVLGIRPYSAHADAHATSSELRATMEWMRQQVPERTLYNWQNSAARLIADSLRAAL